MDNIIKIFGMAVVGVMLASWFEPIQKPKRWLIERTKPFSAVYSLLRKSLNCSKCVSFWVYLIIYQDITGAALCAFIAYMVNHQINKTEAWYE